MKPLRLQLVNLLTFTSMIVTKLNTGLTAVSFVPTGMSRAPRTKPLSDSTWEIDPLLYPQFRHWLDLHRAKIVALLRQDRDWPDHKIISFYKSYNLDAGL